jgi:hypothetical protein
MAVGGIEVASGWRAVVVTAVVAEEPAGTAVWFDRQPAADISMGKSRMVSSLVERRVCGLEHMILDYTRFLTNPGSRSEDIPGTYLY